MQLQHFCEAHGIEAELIETHTSTRTAEDAARALNTSPHQIIKSLVFMVDEEPVLVVVRGPDRVNEAELLAVLEAEDCRLAEPNEVEDATGYHVGEVPPVSTDLRKVVDEQVLSYDEVYGGGGTRQRMIKLDPRFIVEEDTVVESVAD